MLKNKVVSLQLIILITLSAVLNVIGLRLTSAFNIPLYFDAIGTIFVAFVGGTVPGIAVAVLTNILYIPYNADSMCFSLVGVIIAIMASNYTYKKEKSLNSALKFIVELALMSGILSVLIQWVLLGKPQFDFVTDMARDTADGNEISFFIGALFLTVGLNMVDKGISVFLAILAFKAVPEDLVQKLRASSWKQTPLTLDEIKNINSKAKGGGTSIRIKMAIFLTLAVSLLCLIFGFISTRINYDSMKTNGGSRAVDVANFIASIADPSDFHTFLEDGKPVREYDNMDYQTFNYLLVNFQKSFRQIDYLYIYYMQEDGCYIVFDTDPSFQDVGVIGERVDYDEAFVEDIPKFIRGEDIDVKEVDSVYGYFITANSPLTDKNGNRTSFYVGADIAIERYNNYIREYIIRLGLSSAGFFILILAFVLWTSSTGLVFPIGSLENHIECIVKGIDDQEQLDESVRNLEKIDIHTNDELESLYSSLRELANNVDEQMRSIRILARSNEKMQRGLIVIMADIVSNQNMNSKAHIQKISAYCRIILAGLKRKGYYSEKLTDKYINDVEITSPLYDIGKIKIPEAIINKPGPLNREEKEIMNTHAIEGKKILDNAINIVEGESYLKEARNMAAYHHENWDGTGIPLGLHGEVIPLSARVMAIADYFDEITSPRVYRKPVSLSEALEIIKKGSGTNYDPKCVEAFEDNFTEIKNVFRKYPEEDL